MSLQFIAEAGREKRGDLLWECRCDCGKTVVTRASRVKSGRVKSCGCLVGRRATEFHGRHLMSKHPVYKSFSAMKQRCCNPNNASFKDYGGRGIKVCERWLEPDGKGFLNFLEDMGNRPEGMSLDRIDNDGNYEPGNCRWANLKKQANNTRKNVLVQWGSKRLSVSQLSKLLEVNRETLRYWVRKKGACEAEIRERFAA